MNDGSVGRVGTGAAAGSTRRSVNGVRGGLRRMPRVLAAGALLGVLALSACSSDSSTPTETTASASTTPSAAASVTPSVAASPTEDAGALTSANKAGDGTVRTDLEPLMVRWPILGQPVSAQWAGGSLGSADDPSPHTGWLDAVVVVTPDVAKQLTDLGLSASDTPPELTPEIAALVPQGDLLTGSAMASSFALASGQVRAYLVSGTNTVVIAAVGEN